MGEEQLVLPVRRVSPKGVGGLTEFVSDPRHATGVGLVLHGARQELARLDTGVMADDGLFSGIVDRMKSWFEGLFQF